LGTASSDNREFFAQILTAIKSAGNPVVQITPEFSITGEFGQIEIRNLQTSVARLQQQLGAALSGPAPITVNNSPNP